MADDSGPASGKRKSTPGSGKGASFASEDNSAKKSSMF